MNWRKLAISIFVIVNLFTIFYVNLPVFIHNLIDRKVSQELSPQEQYLVRWSIYRLQRYAYIVGLDNRWQMFGRQSRFNWRFQIYGLYTDGHQIKKRLLPEPRQMARSAFQDTIVDFKEGKFHLNLYGNKSARYAYAFYLARRFPSFEGMPLTTVVFEVKFRNLREPRAAYFLGHHLEPAEFTQVWDAFPVHEVVPK